MACIRKRRGKYVVDGRDAFGVRKWVTCDTKAEAERELGRLIGESQSPRMSSADRDMTVADLAERFLKTAEATTKPATQAAYTWAIDSYIVPALGSRKVRQLTRGHAKAFATELASKLQAKSTKNVLGVLHSMLEEAIEAEIVSHNVAARHGSRRSLARLFGPKPADLEERIKAFTREELGRLMGALSKHDPQWLPFFFAISRTGIRLGEAIGLRWDDLDFAGRKVRVARNVSLGATTARRRPPGSNAGSRARMRSSPPTRAHTSTPRTSGACSGGPSRTPASPPTTRRTTCGTRSPRCSCRTASAWRTCSGCSGMRTRGSRRRSMGSGCRSRIRGPSTASISLLPTQVVAKW